MAADGRKGTARPQRRRLRFERLEDRSLLSASAGQTIISDDSGHLFAVNVHGSTALESLGRMDQAMLDIGFTSAGTLLGVKQIVSGSLVTSGLFSIAVNLQNPSTVAQTSLLGAITYNDGAVTLNSLDVRADGTLFAAGTNSMGHGYLFTLTAGASGNVTANVAADLGSYVPAGDLTFDTAGNVYITANNVNGHLLKVNHGSSSVNDLGVTGHNDFMGLAHGSGYTVLGFRQSGGMYTLNTTTGASTLLTTLSGSGLTGIFGAAVVPNSPLDLGTLEVRTLAEEHAFSGNMAYNFTTTHAGLLTARLPSAPPGTNVQFTLYSQDSAGVLTQVGTGSGQRVDLPVAGAQAYVLHLANAPATFDLQLANVVSVSGGTTTVFGTSGDDTFTFTAGSPYCFVINGVPYPCGSIPAPTAVVAFDGGAGLNTAQFTGGAVAGTATFSLPSKSGSYVAAGIQVNVSAINAMTYTGAGADDTVSLTGTPQVDTITLSPRTARIVYRDSVSAQVNDVPHISLDGGGSRDRATFTGGTQALTAAVDYRQADFAANDGSYEIHVANVGDITAIAGSSGADVASMTGSPAKDSLAATPAYVSMYAWNFSNACNGFSNVQAYSGGGEDAALLNAKPNDHNQFAATPAQATLSSTGYRVQVNQYSTVTVNKPSSAYGTASLTGSSTGNDIFVSMATMTSLRGTGYFIRVNAFNAIYAYSTGGQDTSLLYGNSGDDTFAATPTYSILSNSSSYVRAEAFPMVYAYAGAGGADKATLSGSAGADTLLASANTAALSFSDHTMRATAFGTVTAVSNGGVDKKKVYAHTFDLVFQGTWLYA